VTKTKTKIDQKQLKVKIKNPIDDLMGTVPWPTGRVEYFIAQHSKLILPIKYLRAMRNILQ